MLLAESQSNAFSIRYFRELKTLNLQSLRDAIEAITKQLGKYLTAEDLKRIELQIHGLNGKTEKNTTDIRHLFDLVKEV
jgi:hypothetical protein